MLKIFIVANLLQLCYVIMMKDTHNEWIRDRNPRKGALEATRESGNDIGRVANPPVFFAATAIRSTFISYILCK